MNEWGSQRILANVPPAPSELGILASDGGTERNVDLEIQDRFYRKSEAKSVKVALSALQINNVDPVNGARGVPLRFEMRATFSEGMDQASVRTFGAFTLVEQPSNAPVVDITVSYDAASKTATLTPNTSFNPGTTYAASVKGGTGGVKNLAGKPITADHAWAYTTA